MVHLSKTYNDALSCGQGPDRGTNHTGGRSKRAIEEGIVIGQAGRTVFLASEIPAECLRKAEAPVEEEVITD